MDPIVFARHVTSDPVCGRIRYAFRGVREVSLFGLLKKHAQDRLPRVLGAVEILIMREQLKDKPRDRELDHEYAHIREAVRHAKTIASKRKIDPDLAGTVAAIQNIGRILTGKSEGHAEAGYLPAKRFLEDMGCFTPKEIEQIATAVRNHSRKAYKDAPLDELAKDVDIYTRFLDGHEFAQPADVDRLHRIRADLSF